MIAIFIINFIQCEFHVRLNGTDSSNGMRIELNGRIATVKCVAKNGWSRVQVDHKQYPWRDGYWDIVSMPNEKLFIPVTVSSILSKKTE